MTKKFLLLTLCLFILGTFISACGGGSGKTTPPSYPFIPVPTPTPTVSPTPEPTPTPTPTVSPTPEKYPLELSQTEFTVNIGETDNITVTLNGEDITQTATYTVDQEAIATVEAGLITGISVGIATVTVHAENAGADKTFTVNVIDQTLPSLEVNPTEVDLIIGEEGAVTVTLEGKDITEDVTYTVDDKSIANVEKGNIKAKYKGGTANVTVSLEGANNAIFKVNVTDDSDKEVTLNDEILNKLGYIKSGNDIYKNEELVTNLEIPAIFQDNENKKCKIIAIGDNAFEECSSLQSVNIPDSVTHIGYRAFYLCTSLQSVNIPDSVTSIEDAAFYNCTSLKSITIPDSVTHIGYWAFSYCTSLENVTIGNCLTALGEIFRGCSNLKNVTVSDNVLCIFPLAFDGCTNLTKLTTKNGTKIDIPDSGISTKNNVTFIDVKTESNITSVTIPDGVTEIPCLAFDNYTLLTNINIPQSVKLIDSSAIRKCTSLKSITIPDGVTRIGDRAFQYCTSLRSITFEENSNLESIGDYTFYDCGYSDNTANLTLDVPDSVKSIGEKAFYHVNFKYSGTAVDTNHNNWGGNKITE